MTSDRWTFRRLAAIALLGFDLVLHPGRFVVEHQQANVAVPFAFPSCFGTILASAFSRVALDTFRNPDLEAAE